MHRKLPPLKALLAFEAAARHVNFTRAAEELGVTQGAISKQVKLLEEYLGMRLFERLGKDTALTAMAQQYLPCISDAFESIAGATDSLGGKTGGGELLVVNILPSLSNRWLIPMLGDFRRLHPQYSVRLVIGDGPVDFAASDADIAIRAAPRNEWKKLHAEPIMGEELLPVASPRLLAAKRVSRAQDLLTLPLLLHATRKDMWPDYLHSMNVKAPALSYALGCEHFFMLIQAALDGLGVALIPRFLIERELQEGRLEIAYATPFKSPYRYYFICPKRRLEMKKIRTLRKWLLAIGATP